MKIFNSWKKRLVILVSVIAAAIFVPVMAHAAVTFGPSRPTFDWNDPVHYPRYVVFNSFTNNPTWGDERYLIKGRDINASNLSTNVPVTDGETVSLIVYFHNNAATDANKTAQNTTVSIQLPSGEAGTQTVTGNISASNANPGSVFSTMDLTASTPFSLTYEPGSARLSNFKFPGSGTPISDSVVNGGTLVGFDSLNGQVPGCSEFSGYVLIHVKVHMRQTPPPQPQFACTGLDVNEVSRNRFDATAHGSATNATIQSYTFNLTGPSPSTKTVNTSANQATVTFDNLSSGNYTVTAVVKTDHGSTNPNDCKKQFSVLPPNVSFACTGLDVDQTTKSPFTFIAHASVTNATVQSYSFVTKDAGDNQVDSNVVSTSALSAKYVFSTSTAGTYTTSVVIKTDKGSTNPDDCKKVVTVTVPPVTPPTTPPPTTPPTAPPAALPNTGPGSVIAAFAGVSTFAGVFHYLWSGRKFRNLF